MGEISLMEKVEDFFYFPLLEGNLTITRGKNQTA